MPSFIKALAAVASALVVVVSADPVVTRQTSGFTVKQALNPFAQGNAVNSSPVALIRACRRFGTHIPAALVAAAEKSAGAYGDAVYSEVVAVGDAVVKQ